MPQLTFLRHLSPVLIHNITFPSLPSPDRLALASAQSLAIRKLLTKSSYDSTVAPGPPLPASHPSPALLAKLHLEASTLCASADSLLRIPASRKNDMEVAEPLLLYARDGAALHGALARKWLGADAGAHDAPGLAVGFLGWAKRELDVLRDGGARSHGGGKEEGRDGRRERRGRIAAEAEDAAQFLRYYTRMNDTVRACACRHEAFRVPGVADWPSRPPLLLSCRSNPCHLRLICRRGCRLAASRSPSKRLRPPLLLLVLARSSTSAIMQTRSILRTQIHLPVVSRVRRTLQVDHLMRARVLISEYRERLEWSADKTKGIISSLVGVDGLLLYTRGLLL
jgi:hypothetical protein